MFVNPPARVDGTAVFLTAEPGVVPNALLHNLKHNKVLHEQNLFVTVRNHEVPWIPMDKRIEMEPLGHHCWQVIVHYGFKNDIDLPRALEHARLRGCQLEPMTTSYFLSRDVVIPTLGSGMAPWREKLFAQMHHNASGGGGLPEPAEQRGGGAGLEDRDLSSPPGSRTSCRRHPLAGGNTCGPAKPVPRCFWWTSGHNRWYAIFKDLSLSAFTAGFVAVLREAGAARAHRAAGCAGAAEQGHCRAVGHGARASRRAGASAMPSRGLRASSAICRAARRR